MLESRTRPAMSPGFRSSWDYSHHRPARSSQHHDKRLHQVIGIALGPLYPTTGEVLAIRAHSTYLLFSLGREFSIVA